MSFSPSQTVPKMWLCLKPDSPFLGLVVGMRDIVDLVCRLSQNYYLNSLGMFRCISRVQRFLKHSRFRASYEDHRPRETRA